MNGIQDIRQIDLELNESSSCICRREDWVYDSWIGMWCCGCGFVKRATGEAFKNGKYRLGKDGRVEEVSVG